MIMIWASALCSLRSHDFSRTQTIIATKAQVAVFESTRKEQAIG